MNSIHECYNPQPYPLKVLQFGEGNFLRAFADYAIDIANEENGFNGGVAVILPRAGKTDRFSKQDNLYTVCLRGQQHGQVYTEDRVITSIQTVVSARDEYQTFLALARVETLEFVISNTTEAGIVFDPEDAYTACPPTTFPGKLTRFLYERFLYFQGASDKGLIMLPTELNDENGQLLRQCVFNYAAHWQLGEPFQEWLQEACSFVDTLVDRIVTGYPQDSITEIEQALGYKDDLLVQAEPFSLWVIGDPKLAQRFPLASSRFHVEFTDNIKAFKEQKIRILNGAHTSMVVGAYLSGLDYVGQCMADPLIRKQLDQTVFDEIVPTVAIPQDKAIAFAKDVYERFENPFVQHALLSISLNSVSKWKARILPTLKDSLAMKGKLPKWLTFSLAALLSFYHSTLVGKNCLIQHREDETTYEIHDTPDVLEIFAKEAEQDCRNYVWHILKREDFWGEDLTTIPGFATAISTHLHGIHTMGMRTYLEKVGNFH